MAGYDLAVQVELSVGLLCDLLLLLALGWFLLVVDGTAKPPTPLAPV